MNQWTSNTAAGVDAALNRSEAPLIFEDAALLARCREGETEAFGPLVTKYQDRIFNVILRFCGNRSDAEELCQETFVKALEGLATFRRESGFYTWLFRIAVNLAISRRRRGGRVKFHSLESGGSGEEQLPWPRQAVSDNGQIDPHDAAEQAETNQRVVEALLELDEEFRIAVVLRDVEDMNYQQMSQIMSVPVGTVKSRLYRARYMLREKLADLAG